MILADTSIWIDHLRRPDHTLEQRIDDEEVSVHSFVLGELAMGYIQQRDVLFYALQQFPRAVRASDEWVLGFITAERLFGIGLSYIDAHLLASVRLTPGSTLWTRDKRLHAAAERLGIADSAD